MNASLQGLFNSSLTLACGSLLVLAGCFFEDDESFPDISKAQLTGCWSRKDVINYGCREECFDSGAGYYSKIVDVNDSSLFSERSGTFVIKGHEVITKHRIASSRAPASIDSGSSSVGYAMKGGALVLPTADGKSLSDIKYIKSDATHNCGARWRIFAQPPGWSIP